MAEVLHRMFSNIKPITGFEANYHLGQARFLEKLDLADGKRLVGEKLKQAWFEKNKRGVESMKPIPFLTEEKIQNLQEAEASSSRNRRKLPSKSKLSILLVRISWFQHRLVLGRLLSWPNVFWTNWRVVSKFLNSLSQPLR